MLAQLIFFFPKFDTTSGENSSWFGFDRSHAEGQIGALISGLSAMMAVLIARYGQSWLAQWYIVASLSHNGTLIAVASVEAEPTLILAFHQRREKTCPS